MPLYIPADWFPRVFKEVLEKRRQKAKINNEKILAEHKIEVDSMLEDVLHIRAKLGEKLNNARRLDAVSDPPSSNV